MIRKEIVTKFSGPPGTGKSTTLLNVVDGLLSQGVDPEHIVYTTFTRAGAYEARDRACKRFNLPAARLPYFRTLHSLCKEMLPSLSVMDAKDWCAIAKSLHVSFASAGIRDSEYDLGFKGDGDVMRSLYTLAKTTMVSIDQIWAGRENYKGPEILRVEFDRFVETLESYKSSQGKLDFPDMLEKYLKEGPDMHADYIIVDESQDLCPLHWAVVKKLCRHAKKVYIAGDDDQCIHEWNGAAPRFFIDLEAQEYSVLPQSYRIPSTVHALANQIIAKVKNRLPKEYRPRDEVGEVKHVTDLSQVDMSSGSWLLLARTNKYLEGYEKHCQEHGFWFGSRSSINKEREAIIEIIGTWKKLQAGEAVTALAASRMYVKMAQKVHVARGSKTKLYAIPETEMVTYTRLVEEFGLVTPKEWGWSMALNMIDREDTKYLLQVEGRGELSNSPRIRVLTMHASKGLEADNVVINPDIGRDAYVSQDKNPDPEHRVFYVGVTRAKKSLYLLQPQTPQSYDL